MDTRRWTNPSQPQTMQIAVFLLYFGAVLTMLFNNTQLYQMAIGSLFSGSLVDVVFNLVRVFLVLGGAAAGYLIANERKNGYILGVVVAALPLLALLYLVLRFQVSPFRFDLVSLLFDVALFALLVHPQSRSYERIWFKK